VTAVDPKPSPKSKGKQREKSPVATEEAKHKTASELSSQPSSTFKVVVGSYEKLLYGLEGTLSSTSTSGGISVELTPTFIFPAHVSCIKAVAASPNGGKWLATGSSDEIVKVWDLRRKKEIGGLMHHEGSITDLQFPSRSHLLSASEDGSLCLFRARDWSVLRSLKGHKGRVNSVAVHPSGKVALSVGSDKTLRMWDLMRGKGSASTKLGKEGEVVRWSTTGSVFVVQSRSNLEFFSTDLAMLHTVTHPSRVHDVKFIKHPTTEEELLLVAGEDKKLSIYIIPSDPSQAPRIIAHMVGHSNRVKAVDTLLVAVPEGKKSTTIVATISSDGKILVFDLTSLPNEIPEATAEVVSINAIGEYDTKGSRLTCLSLAEGGAVDGSIVTGKRKRTEEEDEEGESDGE